MAFSLHFKIPRSSSLVSLVTTLSLVEQRHWKRQKRLTKMQLMHYSRIMPVFGGHRYLASTAVLINEVFKLAVSLTIAMYDISRTLPPSTPATVLFEQLYNSVFSGDGWKLAIPAALYTLQNSLQYISVSNLDAVHFQILYQVKVRGRIP